MKILYHHRVRSKDGQYVHIAEIVGALRRLGHEVVLVGPPATERESLGGESALVAALRRALPKAAYEPLEFAYGCLAYVRLRRAYRRHRPDVLYERIALFLPAGVWLRKRYGIPMMVEVNAPLYEERARYSSIAFKRLTRWTEEYVWRGADIVLPASEAMAAYIRRSGTPDSRIRVLRNGIHAENFDSAPSTEIAKQRLGVSGRTVLGFTGFVGKWHHVDRIVDLLAESDPGLGLHLVVVGDGPARPGLEEQARRLGIADRVSFTGVVSREKIPQFIAAFDIAFSITDHSYGIALKLVEYMYMGKAIVAQDLPSIREVLTDGQNALLFQNNDMEAFRAAVRRLTLEPELRTRLGENARRTVFDLGLTWDANARRIAKLFDGLLGARG